MEVEIRAKQPSFGSERVKPLADSTNLMPVTPAAAWAMEKMALMKQIQEKNKIIELAGKEIDKLSVSLQKMQRQNWSLAQQNTQLLSVQTMDKKRLLVLQHDLACNKALLKAKEVEFKAKTKVVARKHGHDDENSKPCKISRMGHPSRSRSLGGPVVSELLAGKQALGSKRRQSASSRVIHQEPSEDLFEIDDAEIQILPLKPSDYPSTKEQVTEDSFESKAYEEESRRSSVGRPRRRSAAKIESYKEIPINVKMRRT